jgi:hypothetical protein
LDADKWFEQSGTIDNFFTRTVEFTERWLVKSAPLSKYFDKFDIPKEIIDVFGRTRKFHNGALHGHYQSFLLQLMVSILVKHLRKSLEEFKDIEDGYAEDLKELEAQLKAAEDRASRYNNPERKLVDQDRLAATPEERCSGKLYAWVGANSVLCDCPLKRANGIDLCQDCDMKKAEARLKVAEIERKKRLDEIAKEDQELKERMVQLELKERMAQLELKERMAQLELERKKVEADADPERASTPIASESQKKFNRDTDNLYNKFLSASAANKPRGKRN